MLTLDLTNKIGSSDIAAGANLPQTTLQHRHVASYGQPGAADVAAASAVLHVAYKASTVLAAYVTPNLVSTADKTVTVNLLKSTGGGAWTTILSSNTTITNTSTNCTPVAMTLSGTPTLAAGDVLQAVLAVAGSTGDNVKGILVSAVISENGV